MKKVLSLLLIAVLLLSAALSVPALAVGELPEEGDAPVSAEAESSSQPETEGEPSDLAEPIEDGAADVRENAAEAEPDETARVPAEGGEAPRLPASLEAEPLDAVLTPLLSAGEPTVTHTVTITVNSRPRDGQDQTLVPDLTVSGTGASLGSAYYSSFRGYSTGSDEFTFAEGNTYYICATLSAADGYVFQQGAAATGIDPGYDFGGTCTVTGSTASFLRATASSDGKRLTVWISVQAAAAAPVLTGTATLALATTTGGSIAGTETLQGSDTSIPINTIPAYSSMNMTVVTPAQISLSASPAEGYTFKGWYEGKLGSYGWVDGNTGTVLSQDNPYVFSAAAGEDIKIQAVFEETSSALTPISTVTVNVTPPAAGTTVGSAQGAVSVPADANCSAFALAYYDKDPSTNDYSDPPIPDPAVFPAGYTFYILVTLLANDGYMFSQASPYTTVTVNGAILTSGNDLSVTNSSGLGSYGFCIVSFTIPASTGLTGTTDVYIDNTTDNSVSYVTGAVHITGSGGTQAGYNTDGTGKTVYSNQANVTYSTPRTAQVQGMIDAAYTQVYTLANACKNNGKSGEFHMSASESTGRVWDNRKYDTVYAAELNGVVQSFGVDFDHKDSAGVSWYKRLDTNGFISDAIYHVSRTRVASGEYGKETYYRVEANGWVPGYTITVTDGGNGTAFADLEASLAGGTVTLTATPGTNGRFKEWQVVSGGVTLSGDSFAMPAADVEIKAVFEPIPVYTVTIETDGGSVLADQTVAEGGRITRPADPVKDSCAFAGWYSDAAFTTAFDFDAPITADTTVFARWTATPTPTATPTASSTASPKTGDDTAAGLWCALTLVSGLALAGLALAERKRRRTGR